MLDRRLVLILSAAPIGLVLGVAAWAAAGGPKMADDRIAALEATQPRMRTAGKPAAPVVGDWAGAPTLFDAVSPPEPQVRLFGLSRSTRRKAALISIGGASPVWMTLGEARDGVTLDAVLADSITIDTVGGPRDVRLGEATGGASGEVGSAALGAANKSVDGPEIAAVVGRGPPPPASAPPGSRL
ncbi:hypothetical protein DMC25_00940 [Caulobacter sp. D4A]|uniref:hypothetical protein n=1 Tax=unclassified Caulobacter TaxID=2648921 RepID=UPI000D733912|nr:MULTISPECIES: hypothetical protein [unclassified Caulobacter]PXA95303.1 hypothetical protein DMC25_00940 [Caulobacter sp. D4A]PXA95614.1 hypothetical protein DMC18_03580 [Caulobacter sp. D5]